MFGQSRSDSPRYRASSLRRVTRRLRIAILDGTAWIAALVGAVLLRVDFRLSGLRAYEVATVVPAVVIAQWGFGYSWGLYRGRWVAGSFEELVVLGRTVATVTAVVAVVDLVAARELVPLSATIAAGIGAFVLMGGARSLRRLGTQHRRRPSVGARARVLVFGAGDGGERAVRAMAAQDQSPYVPVAFLDDDPEKRGLTIQGVRVVGNRNALAHAAEQFAATVLLIAVPSANSALIRELARAAEERALEVRLLPSLRELLDGEVRIVDIREPNDEDMLGRQSVDIDLTLASSYLTGRVVAVTGAGGSIGAELCRQVALFGPAELIMIDRDESALHAVQMSLHGRALLDSDDMALLDVRDHYRVARLFQTRRPDVVFHAAALKHLPLLESHPAEALKTNVWGTRAVLDAAASADVERFVNISTDKAANPSSVLGYSKRLCEGLTAHYAEVTGEAFLSVRFGNVIKSRGSVLTSFKAQLETGGPLTVTHPDVTRYFMSVEEAVELVLLSGAIGHGGQVLVLDMGEPVRIADVARRMAAHANPPIKIEYTGLRPGEKLHEDLFADDEVGLPSDHPMISYVDAPLLSPSAIIEIDPTQRSVQLRALLQSLCEMMSRRSGTSIVLSGQHAMQRTG